MRKLTASFYISLDGVVDAPHEWHFPMVDDAMMSDVAAALEESDTILLGRATYQEWADFWPHQPASNPMAGYFNSTPKLVVSTTLASADWENTTLISNDVAAQVDAAKRRSGMNISVTGSGTLVRSLLGHGLVDELRLMIHPVVVGRGKRLFREGDDRSFLELVDSKAYPSGVLNVTYVPSND